MMDPQQMQVSAVSVLNACNQAGGCIGQNVNCSMEHLFQNYIARQSGTSALSNISRPASFCCL